MKKTVKNLIAIIFCALSIFGAAQQALAADSSAQIETPFIYNESSDYYYLPDDNAEGSYDVFYEKLPTSVMKADFVQIPFEYDGKSWLIQLCKGQYGWLFIGSDVTVFTSDKKVNDINDFSLASEKDELEIMLSCTHNTDNGSTELFALENSNYRYANGFSKGQLNKYTTPVNELKTYAQITFKSDEMAALFANGLKNAGFSENEQLNSDCFFRSGAKVALCWSDINYPADFQADNSDENDASGSVDLIDKFAEIITQWLIKIYSIFAF